MYGLESIFGSAMTPAVTSGIGEAAVQTAVPTMTDATLNAGVDQAISGTMANSLGQISGNTFNQIGKQGVANSIPDVAPTSMWDSIGDYAGKAGNFMTSNQGANAMKLGTGAFNMYNQNKGMNHQIDVQNAQLAQSEDAYARNKAADERRQKLVF